MRGFTLVELIVTIAIILVIAFSVIAIKFGGVGWYCARKWDGFETQYDLIVGCKVKVEGHFVPENHVRQF